MIATAILLDAPSLPWVALPRPRCGPRRGVSRGAPVLVSLPAEAVATIKNLASESGASVSQTLALVVRSRLEALFDMTSAGRAGVVQD